MITGIISIDDFLNAQRLHRANALRGFYRFFRIAILIAIPVCFYLVKALGLTLALLSIGVAIGGQITSKLILPWKVRRLHRQQKDLAFPFTYTWNAEFLEGQGVSGQSKRAWTNYHKFREDRHVFLLYHSDNLFEVFPKRWFSDNEQIDEFRRLASQAGQA